VRTRPRPGEPAGRGVRDPVGARPLQLLAPIAAQPQRRARHAASRSHTEWPTTTVSVMSTSSRSAAARNRSGSGLAWPPGPAQPPARRRVGTWSTSRVGHAASGSPLVAPPTAPAGCSGAAAAGGRRAAAAPSRRGAHRPRHGLAGAGRPRATSTGCRSRAATRPRQTTAISRCAGGSATPTARSRRPPTLPARPALDKAGRLIDAGGIRHGLRGRAACLYPPLGRHGWPATARGARQGRPQAGPEDRPAPVTRSSRTLWQPRQRPVRGRGRARRRRRRRGRSSTDHCQRGPQHPPPWARR
jgi:hypothetical protein